ncbi:MAG: hypothetical protein LKF33_06285 [Prevotella sp.]|jgi:hypothetical protein|nr:hypothetical protein [Prevotella sp.]
MTKAQVTSVFGANTEVCKFNKVVRDATSKVIKLYFTDNVYSTTTDENANVIVGHNAYMIYPTTKTLAEGESYVFKNYSLDEGGVTATQVTAVNGTGESAAATTYVYNFIGNYLKNTITSTDANPQRVTIPQYSYFLGADENDNNKHKYFFETGTTGKFNPYTAIVEPSDGKDDSFVESAKQLNSIFGEDADVTGIDKIEIIAGNENKVVGVYNLNGQKVSSTNSLEGLAKGLYIVNGKKYIVK